LRSFHWRALLGLAWQLAGQAAPFGQQPTCAAGFALGSVETAAIYLFVKPYLLTTHGGY
jgi:hypothetical protein